MKKLYVGIDLAIRGCHRASVYDLQENRYLDNSFAFAIDFEGFDYMLHRVQSHINSGEQAQLHFVMEPTALAWMPLSCYLISRGHKVWRVTPQQSADFRKFRSKYAKSDRIDCQTLAKLPVVAEDRVRELYLPQTNLGALSRWTRHLAKISQQAASRKVRIESLFVMINPKVLAAFGDKKFSPAARTLYRHFVNPYKIAEMGKEPFAQLFRSVCPTDVTDELLENVYDVSVSTTRIYDGLKDCDALPFDYQQLEEEVKIELEILEYCEKKMSEMQRTITQLYKQIDPHGHLMTPQGIGIAVAPAILGIIGDVSRFPAVDDFRGFFGFIPKKKQSSTRNQRGLSIHKAAQNLLKKYLYLAAETARQYDPEFAAFYHRLSNRGLHHYQAVCAVANKLAGRVYALLKRMQRAENSLYVSSGHSTTEAEMLRVQDVGYKLRDLDGNVIDKKRAREIVLSTYPSASQKNKIEKTRKAAGRAADRDRSVSNDDRHKAKHESGESTTSQTVLTDQPRQPPEHTPARSSLKSGTTLPTKTLLEDMLSRLSEQVQWNSKLHNARERTRLDSPGCNSGTDVNNLRTGGD